MTKALERMVAMHHENIPLADDELQRWHVSEDVWAELRAEIDHYAAALPFGKVPAMFRAGDHVYIYGRRVVPVSGLPPNSIVIERRSLQRRT